MATGRNGGLAMEVDTEETLDKTASKALDTVKHEVGTVTMEGPT